MGWEMLSLRMVCKSLWEKLPKEAMKREYDVKRSKLEEALIRNRRDLLRINLQIDKIIRGPGETRDQFIQLMMENDDIVQTLRLMEGGVYDDSKLEEFGFVPYHFSPISRIHGLNFWTIDVPDRGCGILLIPKEVCHWCNCQRHQVRHSIMILEAKLHPWGFGIEFMLEDREDEPFRSTRYLPVCDTKEGVSEKLRAMNLREDPSLAGWILEGSTRWRYAAVKMRHPPTTCFEHKRCFEDC